MMIETNYQKECPECGQDYTGTRLNQVYCSRSCKIRHNNRKARLVDAAQSKHRVITEFKSDILWRNRQLLKEYVGQTVKVEILKEKGFRLNFITDFSLDKTQRNLLHVYDYGYYFIDSKTIKIYEI